MKKINRIMRNGVAIAILMLSLVPQTIDAKAQWDSTQNTSENSELAPPTVNLNESGADRPPFGDSKPPLQAPPPEGGDGQKLPVDGGFWILAGLAVVYGIVCKKFKKT